MELNAACVLVLQTQEEVVSASSKLRWRIYIFRECRGFKAALERQLQAARMKVKLLTLDMLVRWGATYNMLRLACEMEAPITAVCATQQIDLLVWSIALTHTDWALTKHLRELFSVFAHPTKKLQASTYPTSNNAILQFLSIANLKRKNKRGALIHHLE
jgi:hypothetical protein